MAQAWPWTTQPHIVPYAQDRNNTCPPLLPDHPRFSSYSEYIHHLFQTVRSAHCFKWLHNFFTTLPDTSRPLNTRPETRTLVGDALETGWRLRGTLDHQTLSDEQGVLARVVVVECEKLAWIDRPTLDVLALFYDLNPIYLWGLFSRNRVDLDYLDVDGLLRVLMPKPRDWADYHSADISAIEFIHTHQKDWDQVTFILPSMSGLVVSSKQGQVPTGQLYLEYLPKPLAAACFPLPTVLLILYLS